jgi:hypothetical protein
VTGVDGDAASTDWSTLSLGRIAETCPFTASFCCVDGQADGGLMRDSVGKQADVNFLAKFIYSMRFNPERMSHYEGIEPSD